MLCNLNDFIPKDAFIPINKKITEYVVEIYKDLKNEIMKNAPFEEHESEIESYIGEKLQEMQDCSYIEINFEKINIFKQIITELIPDRSKLQESGNKELDLKIAQFNECAQIFENAVLQIPGKIEALAIRRGENSIPTDPINPQHIEESQIYNLAVDIQTSPDLYYTFFVDSAFITAYRKNNGLDAGDIKSTVNIKLEEFIGKLPFEEQQNIINLPANFLSKNAFGVLSNKENDAYRILRSILNDFMQYNIKDKMVIWKTRNGEDVDDLKERLTALQTAYPDFFNTVFKPFTTTAEPDREYSDSSDSTPLGDDKNDPSRDNRFNP